jgi:carbonic anhydrase/acetyltransferase-like protein (isoleucine patch superfamily)
MIMENAVIRGTRRHPTTVGDNVLVGPHAYLTGCTVADNLFLATGSTVFNGARLGERADVRINGTVHINTILKPDQIVPIGWVAVGNPAKIFPPKDHAKIWRIQKKLNFPRTVWGLETSRRKGETIMPEVARRYTRALMRHKDDKVVG